jgi:hypothetical protein
VNGKKPPAGIALGAAGYKADDYETEDGQPERLGPVLGAARRPMRTLAQSSITITVVGKLTLGGQTHQMPMLLALALEDELFLLLIRERLHRYDTGADDRAGGGALA